MLHRKIKFALVFNRTNKLTDAGTALVQIRAYQGGKNIYFSSGVYLKPNQWDNRNRRVKHTHPRESQLNKIINDQVTYLVDLELSIVEKYGRCPVTLLKSNYQRASIDERPTFIAFAREELKRPEISPNTRKGQNDSINKLERFQSDISFDELDEDLIKGFDRWMGRKGLSNSTINRHHRTIRRYVSLAIKAKLLDRGQDPYYDFEKRREQEPDRITLSELELKKMEDLSTEPNTHEQLALHLFLLSCYTGMRFSDMVTLTPHDLEETEHGILLTKRMVKTKGIIKQPLWMLFPGQAGEPTRPEKLIAEVLHCRRSSLHVGRGLNVPLFSISQQYYNRILKRLATRAGIDKQITSHVGRRTFLTLLSGRGLSPAFAQKLAGHKDIKTTMIYVNLSQEQVLRGLENVKWGNG